jgi:hypothetical protein
VDLSLLKAIITVVMIGGVLACGTAIFRLIYFGLGRSYPLLVAWLSAVFIESAAIPILQGQPATLAKFWTFSDPLVWIFQTAAVAELYRQILKHYPGIGSAGRWICALLLALAAAACAVTLSADLAGQNYLLKDLMVGRRVVNTIATVFLVLTAATFFVQLKVPTRSNVVAHCYISTVYFATVAAAALAISLNRASRPVVTVVNLVLPVINTACFLAWGFGMTREGELFDRNILTPEQRRELAAARRNLHLRRRSAAHSVGDSSLP